jgi:cysteinyl-tRNA synthetase
LLTEKGRVVTDEDIPAEIIRLVEDRQSARAQGDWTRADRVREKIESLGYQISDTGEGFRLTRK